MLKLTWYMRGGVSITELYDMEANHISHITSIVESNFELSKQAGVPIL